MSYIIHKTDGTILTEIIDGAIDQLSTDLTLLGKNANSYGEYWNENLVHVLENFANTTSPNQPIVGQLWFDTSDNRLKIYDGSTFKVTSGTFVSTTPPSGLTQGDIWIDSKNQQLYFNDGVATVLAGPLYTTTQGICGFVVSDIQDTDEVVHTVVMLMVSDTLLGIYSTTEFTPAEPISGFTKDLNVTIVTSIDGDNDLISVVSTGALLVGQAIRFKDSIGGLQSDITYYVLDIPDATTFSVALRDGTTPVSLASEVGNTTVLLADVSNDIKVGFNSGSLNNTKIHSTVTAAEALIDTYGHIKTAESFLSTQYNSATIGTISILNTTPLLLGNSGQSEIQVSNAAFSISSNIPDQNFKLNLNSAGTFSTAMIVNANTKRVGIYTDTPTAMLDVNGDVVVQGTLTVKGNVTTINTTDLAIKDKLIEIGKTDSPSNSTAAGGGISLQGGSDNNKTMIWGLADGWSFNDAVSVIAGKTFKINSTTVISETSLGTTIVSAPGLNSIGTLNQLQVDNININDQTISYVNSSVANGDIVLAPKGTGVVNVSSKRITAVATATDNTDAVNFAQLVHTVKIFPLAISMDATAYGVDDSARNTQIANYLQMLFPADEHEDTTKCRVMCTISEVLSIRIFILTSGVWTFQSIL
jgi:hypothetical protein